MSDYVYAAEYLNIPSARVALLYSYENIYGLFRPKKYVKDYDNSLYYELISYEAHKDSLAEDVLLDLCILIKAGKTSIEVNDVVCIRLNGKLVSYRYICKPAGKIKDIDCFIRIQGFMKEEWQSYIERIHKDNKVISVLDGQLLSVDNSNLKNKRIYCIDEEVFMHEKKFVNNAFTLYGLDGCSIKSLNPGGRPFISLKNALYYFARGRKREKKSLLLLNRKELEMIKDHVQLCNVELDIKGA